jgi:hypothetical protein
VGAGTAYGGVGSYGAIAVFEWDGTAWSQQLGSGYYNATNNPSAIIVGTLPEEAMGNQCSINGGDANGLNSGTIMVAAGWRAQIQDDAGNYEQRRGGRVTTYQMGEE